MGNRPADSAGYGAGTWGPARMPVPGDWPGRLPRSAHLPKSPGCLKPPGMLFARVRKVLAGCSLPPGCSPPGWIAGAGRPRTSPAGRGCSVTPGSPGEVAAHHRRPVPGGTAAGRAVAGLLVPGARHRAHSACRRLDGLNCSRHLRHRLVRLDAAFWLAAFTLQRAWTRPM